MTSSGNFSNLLALLFIEGLKIIRKRIVTQWYSTIPLSFREQREYEQVLLEELETQCWYSVTWCTATKAEVFLCIQ